MVVPVNTTVTLEIRAQDVAHSWWIPTLGGKFDAVPGYTNYTWFKATQASGTYTGQCAELCGRNHANMTARVTRRDAGRLRGLVRGARSRTSPSPTRPPPPRARARRRRTRPFSAARRRPRPRNRPAPSDPGPVWPPRRSPPPRPRRRSRRSSRTRCRARSAGWISWLTTTDHKRIGIMYLVALVDLLHGRRRRGAADAPAARAGRTTRSLDPADVQRARSRCTGRR